MTEMTAKGRLERARKQLARVQVAWLDPTDWSDLSMYGLYALENAVVAAAEHLDVAWEKVHWKKADLAAKLHLDHDLPDVSDLLRELNELRKSEAYDEVAPSRHYSAEVIAVEIESYIEAVAAIMEGSG